MLLDGSENESETDYAADERRGWTTERQLRTSAFGNGSTEMIPEISLPENYLTDSIHVKC